MKYVYLIRSHSHPKQSYIGITSDLEKRLIVHNSGGSVHTSKFKPWKLVAYFAFSDSERAVAFERYLKTGSGRAFAKKIFWESGHFSFMG
jgi:putative endonuclease